MTLEVPVDGVKQVAIENRLVVPGGRFGRDYQLSIGTGVGDGFEESGDTELLALLGGGSELPPETVLDDPDYPQPRDYWYTGGRFGEPLLTSLAGAFELSPGDEAAGLFVVQISDAADGVIDGLAQFTLRQVLPGTAGDYNNDGVTDMQDYSFYRDAFTGGDESLVAMADGNGNGRLDSGDYTVWRDALGQTGVDLIADAERYGPWVANFGSTSLSPGVATTPEPTGLLLGCSAIFLYGAGRRRRHCATSRWLGFRT
ncbi:MAG: hypothetical protein KDA37_05870 [Planctomycetales bacterium]|nr:hypothetical protein [Planctomycetales bacterium]